MPNLGRFGPAKGVDAESTPNLFVANCGPAVGISHDSIAAVFSAFGEVKGVYAADVSGARVVVSFADSSSAQSAMKELNGKPCTDLGGRTLHIRPSMFQSPSCKVNHDIPVALAASDLNIPGLYLMLDFVSAKEEEELLAEVDSRPWKSLAKRRVQHYGYEFQYNIRNVDPKQHLGELPSFVSSILERVSLFSDVKDPASFPLDQLTVNEYPPGVGLSPHIDTHSAFEGCIFSLSLAGPCIMEFRRYSEGTRNLETSPEMDMKGESTDNGNFSRKAIYLPPRSMLLLSREARYAWHHYIPHHKIDKVNDNIIRRGSRRVSFTFRKVRASPCKCEFSQYCDSRR